MSKKKQEQELPKNPCAPAADHAAADYTAPAETGADLAAMETEMQKLREDLGRSCAEREQLGDRFLRLAAEFDNFRKRSQKEREAIYSDTVADVILGMLPVYDNLERALSQPTQDSAFLKGVELTMKQFDQCLEKLGVSEIPAAGQPFDPTVHNAVMHVEDESLGEGMVAEVFQKGFSVGERVIRHAMVKVAN